MHNEIKVTGSGLICLFWNSPHKLERRHTHHQQICSLTTLVSGLAVYMFCADMYRSSLEKGEANGHEPEAVEKAVLSNFGYLSFVISDKAVKQQYVGPSQLFPNSKNT